MRDEARPMQGEGARVEKSQETTKGDVQDGQWVDVRADLVEETIRPSPLLPPDPRQSDGRAIAKSLTAPVSGDSPRHRDPFVR